METEDIKVKLTEELNKTVRKNCTQNGLGVAFSGGVDSSLLARLCSDQGKNVQLLTVGFFDAQKKDEIKKTSSILNLPIFIKELDLDALEKDLKNIIKSKPSSLVELEIVLAFYQVFKLAKDNGIRTVLSANGIDELFCGYNKYKEILENKGTEGIKNETDEFLANAKKTFLMNKKTASDLGIDFIEPFLDDEFIEFAREIPVELKIKNPQDNLRKHIIREVALDLNVPREIALKRKDSMQYSTSIHAAIEKLARRNFTKPEAKKLGFQGVTEAYRKTLLNQA